MSRHIPITPEERESRNQLATRYKNGQKKDRIDDEIRGIRMAINILITKEQELQEESRKLSPKRRTA
jgi:hypothetical protein